MKNFWRGFQVSCYNCHDGPNRERPATNRPPVVNDVGRTTPTDAPLSIALTGTDPDMDPVTLRIVSQPTHGKVAFDGSSAVYRADSDYVGPDTFSYAANDGFSDSNLGTVTMTVTAPACAGSAEPFGFACPGSGDHLPRLALTGCPAPGENVTMIVDRGLGGAPSVLAFGDATAEFETASGCVLRVGGNANAVPFLTLGGVGPGTGAAALSFTIPPSLPATTLYFQVFVPDMGASGDWSATNALTLDIRPSRD